MNMAKCENRCTICNGEFCDNNMAKCACCGEEFQAGMMLHMDGKLLCLRCYAEMGEKHGFRITA